VESPDTAVLENDLIAQSFLPAISSQPKATKRFITQLRFLAKVTITEFFADKNKLKLFTRNNITAHAFFEKSCFDPVFS
jgi:hypothetical protein